jgi:hypothetical protein
LSQKPEFQFNLSIERKFSNSVVITNPSQCQRRPVLAWWRPTSRVFLFFFSDVRVPIGVFSSSVSRLTHRGVLKGSYTLTVRMVSLLRLLGHTSLATLFSTQAAEELSLVFIIDLLNSFCLLLDK